MKFVLLVLLAVTLAAANAEKIVGGTKTDIANYPWQVSDARGLIFNSIHITLFMIFFKY